ncbi:hypothetical protein JAAARDRAFT_58577 [Jaapia argillacea MUCL 33604]|uniref:Ferritin-like domain-containing protein n=1 Tax=Jaapia argillacea MUCL 33604 TaxID=933084 RepID=A0A067PQJ8_9AGAM|nr:hypothetical protein JAAARDRAFT_58577 [Jaapia argillacea MUCL 33604]
MKAFTFATLAIGAFNVYALPSAIKRADAIDDTTILNFALTLEHLENAFYSGGLAEFDDAAFAQAGLPPYARGRFIQVAQHEAAHVDYLTKALGEKATQPCQYSFPYNDPKSFAALAQALESVGVSAYSGAAKLFTNKDYLTVAAVVLSTEARHASWVASAVNKLEAWSGNFDVPLSLNEVYSMASNFITSCPSTNPTLPVKAFPALDLAVASPSPAFPNSKKITPGSTISVTSSAISSSTEIFLVFFTGLDQIFVKVVDGKAVVPESLRGTVYAVASTDGTSAGLEAGIIAGPVMLEIDFDSQGNIEA